MIDFHWTNVHLSLSLGDDAARVKWFRLDRNLHLYASHDVIVRAVVKKLGAYRYWEN
jgi:hypothetical protein